MAGKGSDDSHETSRSPAPRRETESNDMEAVSPSANLFSGGSASDDEQITRVLVAPPRPPTSSPRAMNAMDAYLLFLQRQETELSVNLKGRAARGYARGLSDGGSAAGEEKDVSSPWRFVSLSELIMPQPPADDQRAAEAYHSVAKASPPVPPADLHVLQALDSGDAPGPVQARLPLRALPPQSVRQDTLLDLWRRPPSLIHRQSI